MVGNLNYAPYKDTVIETCGVYSSGKWTWSWTIKSCDENNMMGATAMESKKLKPEERYFDDEESAVESAKEWVDEFWS